MKLNYRNIKLYLDRKEGSLTEKDLKNWFSDLSLEKELRVHSKNAWDEMEYNYLPGSEYDENRILGRIYRDIKYSELKNKAKFNGNRVLNIMMKVAAVLFIPFLLLYLNERKTGFTDDPEVVFTEIFSPPGARTMFYLPDGSHGWLNGDSYLRFPNRFETSSRNVSLRGEAYFDVVSNPEVPFIVSAKNLDITARGTSFNITAWEDEEDTRVVLSEGKLEISLKGDSEAKPVAILDPGQMLLFAGKENKASIQKADVEIFTSWTEGKMIFRNEAFRDVVKRLNRWYNVNILIKDNIPESYRLVATFEDESLDEILKLLALSAPIRFRELKRIQSEDGSFGKRTIEMFYTGNKQ